MDDQTNMNPTQPQDPTQPQQPVVDPNAPAVPQPPAGGDAGTDQQTPNAPEGGVQ